MKGGLAEVSRGQISKALDLLDREITLEPKSNEELRKGP